MGKVRLFLTKQRLEQSVWFILLLSWLPFLYGQNIFLLGQSPYPILLPQQTPIIPMLHTTSISFPALGFMSFLSLAALVAAITLREKKLVIPALYIVAANFTYVFNGSTFGNINAVQSLIYWIVLGSFIASVVTFMIHGHILSPAFSLFACLLVIDAIIYNAIEWWSSFSVEIKAALASSNVLVPDVVGDPFALLTFLYGAYRPSFGLALVIILSLVLIRAFFLTWQDNKPFLKVVDRKILASAAFTTILKLWWPMPLVFIVMSVVWYLLFDIVVARQIICVLDQTQISGGQCHPAEGVTLESALDAYTQATIASAQVNFKSGVDASKDQILETTGKAPNATANAVDDATRGRLPGTNTDRCGFLDVICYIKNGVKSAANRGYQKARSAAIDQIRNDLAKLDQAAIEKAGGIQAATVAAVDTSAANVSAFTASSIRAGFATFRAVSFLLSLYSVLILIKTFLIVFARVLFDPNKKKPIHAQFLPGALGRGFGTIGSGASSVTVPKTLNEDRFYTYRGMRIAGPKKDRSFPLKGRFFVSRLLCGRLSFLRVPNRSCAPELRRPATLNLNAPAQIVEWQLKPKEQVVFRFADLQGFSSDVTFHRRASMSISTLIFGRVILYYAEGPGTILLRTGATAEISGSQPVNASEPETFVAWGMPLTYYVDAKLDWVNTFISSVNLQVQMPGHFIRDTDDRRVSSTGGILRFVTNFLLPI